MYIIGNWFIMIIILISQNKYFKTIENIRKSNAMQQT